MEQRLRVPFAYPVHFTRDVFDVTNPLLVDVLQRASAAGPQRALAVCDDGLVAACPDMPARIRRYGEAHHEVLEWVDEPQLWPGGEAAKNDWDRVGQLVDALLHYRLCRHSYVVVIGGGAVLDAVGFAAALVHRGLRVIRVPSTTLAQNDAGVGVKNGLNRRGAKNAIGTFLPPYAVLNDLALLAHLPFIHWIGGVAEAFKVALIKSASFFHECCANAARYRARDAQSLESLIVRCAEWHLAHIRTSGDPFEMGRARPLDFGHWAAHKLESLSRHRITHGEAVATGVMIDAAYASRQGWLATRHVEALRTALLATGFPLVYPELQQRDDNGELALLAGLDEFREHLGGTLCITFPRGLGHKQDVHTINRALMTEVMGSLIG